MMTADEWINEVSGKPWVNRASGPDSFDCWGLVVDYFRRVKQVDIISVPGYSDGSCSFSSGMTFMVDNGFITQSSIDEALIFTQFVGGEATHVGILIGDRVIHALGSDESGGQVYNHTMTHIRRIFKGDRLEFWKCH